MPVEPVPEGFHTLTPYIVVKDVAKLIDFLKAGFDAKEIVRHGKPDGSVMHAQLRIGDSFIMMGEQPPNKPAAPAMLYLYVADCDAWYNRAIAAGATSMMPPMNMFYGDRHGGVSDAWGNQWWIATHIEDVSEAEMAKRAEEAMKKGQCG
jgi:PhnB protein